MSSLVTSMIEDGVAILRLNDPEHRNALSPALSNALAAAVQTALESGAGALVLTAEPPVFCAGGSLDALLSRDVPLAASYAGFLALANAPVPTIAAIASPAIGSRRQPPLGLRRHPRRARRSLRPAVARRRDPPGRRPSVAPRATHRRPGSRGAGALR